MTPGEPAFPAQLSDSGPQHGISAECYIATQAMAALLANPTASACIARDTQKTGRDFDQELAVVACDMAHALLDELAKRGEA